MKKKRKNKALSLAAAVLLLSTTVSLAWFARLHFVDINKNGGSIVTSYFHQGDGTEEHPYEITRPVHFYNLVMLYQANPAFKEGFDFITASTHFRIGTKDLDLDGVDELTDFSVFEYSDSGETDDKTASKTLNLASYGDGLFPIGSAEKPFQATLDGENITLKNLKIVGSVNIDETEYTTPDIGLFGYVSNGSSETAQPATIKNIYIEDMTIDLTNVDITGQHSTTTTTVEHNAHTDNKAYVGYIAGHIITGAQVNDVYVNNCTIVGGNEATSGFGFFGYVEDENGVSVSTLAYDIEKLRGKGNGEGFGGSINMKDIFERLDYFENKASQLKTYNTVEIYDTAGNLISSSSAAASYTFTTTLTGTGSDTVTLKTYSSESEGSYNFTEFNTKNNDNNDYKTLYGASSRFITTLVKEKGVTDTVSGFYICDSNSGTKNYMCYDMGTNSIVNSASPSTIWNLNSDGHLSFRNVISANGTFIADEAVRYVNYTGGMLTVSDTGTTEWIKNDTNNQIYTTVGGNDCCIYYSNGWTVSSGAPETYYRIKNVSNYMTVSDSGVLGVTTSADDAALFVQEENSDGTVYLRVAGGTNYLNASYSFSTTFNLNISTSGCKFYKNSGNLYLNNPSNKKCYVYYASKWRTTGSTGSKYQTTVESAGSVSYNAYSETANNVSVQLAAIEKKKNGADTYFPIRVTLDDKEAEEITNYSGEDKYNVSSQNTGYIIAGANVEDAVSLAGNDKEKSYGDIRVSEFNVSRISNSYSNGSFTTLYSENADGQFQYNVNSTGEAYTNAKEQLLSTLSGTNKIYGLHFMDSEISTDHIITADKVTVRGKTYTNYQMPEDCIDFNVVERGTINFFAGTYFTGNNAFFTLNVITRDKTDKTKIISIKEIRKIYSKSGAAHVYLYSDGTYSNGKYSSANIPENNGYTLAFDCEWITNPSALQSNALYYFEIPVEVGEYALGSVQGKNGAYLVYLDIAANGGSEISQLISSEGNDVTNAFRAEYRTSPEKLGENNYSVLLFSTTAPQGTNADSFSVNISFEKLADTDADYQNYKNGIYTITVTNKSGNDIRLDVYLCDDDRDATNDFLYAYKVVYNNTTQTGATVKTALDTDYWQAMASFNIPSSETASEVVYTQ